MTKLQFMKGLLGASALTVLSAGSAFAQDNNFTQAGTEVVNTFNLTYDVGSVAQPPITNDNFHLTKKMLSLNLLSVMTVMTRTLISWLLKKLHLMILMAVHLHQGMILSILKI